MKELRSLLFEAEEKKVLHDITGCPHFPASDYAKPLDEKIKELEEKQAKENPPQEEPQQIPNQKQPPTENLNNPNQELPKEEPRPNPPLEDKPTEKPTEPKPNPPANKPKNIPPQNFPAKPNLPPAQPQHLCEGCKMDCRTDIRVKEKGENIITK